MHLQLAFQLKRQRCRTARNYRRLSGSQKKAVVDRTEKCHLRSVSSVLAAMPGSSEGKQRGGDYISHERYSYLLETKNVFRQGKHLSLTLDGVQLGEPLLNAIAGDDRARVSCILPPQAGLEFSFDSI